MKLRFISYVMAFLAMGSFVQLYLSGDDLSILQKRVFVIDLMTIVLLFAGAYLDGFGFQRFTNFMNN